MTTYYKEFDHSLFKIPQEYNSFIKAIHKLVRIIDDLFVLQISSPQMSVFPQDFKKNEEAFENKYSVLRLEGNRYIEIPYHQFYKQIISQIIEELDNISQIVLVIENVDFKRDWWIGYLEIAKSAFLTDTWDELEAYYLTASWDDPFLLSIGPIERYHDNFFGIKRFYSGWLLYRDTFEAKKYQELWNLLEEMGKNTLHPLAIPDNLLLSCQLFLGNSICKGGEVAKFKATGWSRPENGESAQRNGSIKIISLNEYLDKMTSTDAEIKKYAKLWKLSVIEQQELHEYLKDYPLHNLIMHEFGHTFLKPLSASADLEKFYTLFEEARAEINMLYLAMLLEKRSLVSTGFTKYTFLSTIYLYHFLLQEFTTNEQRLEYLLSTVLWIYKGIEFGILQNTAGRIQPTKLLNEKLDEYILSLFMFLNSIVSFGSFHNSNLKKYEDFITAYNEELHNSLRIG